ncbi:hypothetical protein GCM10010211_08470 [Streptomyces albospinus]|uniref:Uncharacterized protein n=1 Tax=Streptomyces albospinus TaxID=285515 RepID=A0ABQ2US69_9ACTN|nr:hypothetical protein GCM10010211_08470 [Streptomyces albospinus]
MGPGGCRREIPHPVRVLDILLPVARTARSGAARVGAQLRDVPEVLGPPWDRGSSTGADGLPYLYAYGCLAVATCHAPEGTGATVPRHRRGGSGASSRTRWSTATAAPGDRVRYVSASAAA